MIVIGGGVVGVACAYSLLALGRSVCVLEAGTLGNGASRGNCGLLTPSHALPLTRPETLRQTLGWFGKRDAPFYVRPRADLEFLSWGLRFLGNCRRSRMEAALRGRAALLGHSLDLTRDWIAAEGIECEWSEGGLLEVFERPSALEGAEGVRNILADHGIEAHLKSAEETLVLEPGLRADRVAGSLFHPRDAHLQPQSFLDGLGGAVQACGGTLELNCPVEGITVGSTGARVRTTRGDWLGSQLLVAAGAWSTDWQRPLNLNLPIQPGKGYSLTLPPAKGAPTLPLLLHEANMVVTPWPSGLRLGGTMELSGRNLEILPGRLQALRRGARQFLRCDVDAPGEEWVGWRPMTPDELPLLGRVPGFKRVFVAAGHGMMGVSMCAASGDCVARMMAGLDPGLDPTPYSLARFG